MKPQPRALERVIGCLCSRTRAGAPARQQARVPQYPRISSGGRMRKFLIAAAAAVSVFAVAAVAYAANVYTVDGSTSPRGKGTAGKPLPVSLNFDFSVRDENPANRGTPVEKYFIGAEGLVTYPEAFPTCSGGTDGVNATDLATVKRVCKKARVGGGVIRAYAGAEADQTQKLNCVLELNLYNLKPGNYGPRGRISKKNGGLAIRVDGVPPGPPALDRQYMGECALPQNEAILAPYKTVKVKGVTSDELQFTVPQSLLHPATGAETVVQFNNSSIKKRTATKRIKGKNRKVGFYSAIGCKGKQRSIQVTFIDEAGDKVPVTKNKPC